MPFRLHPGFQPHRQQLAGGAADQRQEESQQEAEDGIAAIETPLGMQRTQEKQRQQSGQRQREEGAAPWARSISRGKRTTQAVPRNATGRNSTTSPA